MMRPSRPGWLPVARRGRRVRNERGYVTVVVAVLVPTVFFGLCAIAVDVSRMYVEIARVQKAADAAALAGVTYMPTDLGKAGATATHVAASNGYDAAAGDVIQVEQGKQPSQLEVAVTTEIDNVFGSLIGIPTAHITRHAVADYTAPAPMGSPCNTFGNEPEAGSHMPGGSALPATPFPNCSSQPQFWAAVNGPGTDKIQGDRYQAVECSGTYGCNGGRNTERKEEGYFFTVSVEPEAVNTPIEVQLYDPAFVFTSVDCGALRDRRGGRDFADAENEFTDDPASRYDDEEDSGFCSGDYNPGNQRGGAPTTSFVLRGHTDTNDPMKAAPIAGCTKQFRGRHDRVDAAELTGDDSDYNRELSRVFHQWVTLCTFTPSQAGDHYLQVRTDVAFGGSQVPNTNGHESVVSTENPQAAALTGNTTEGVGLNAFSMRAIPADATMRSQVAVSGWYRMPILQNAPSSTATFNLVRALPSTRGQYIQFSFYDAADGSSWWGGSVTVNAPPDATGAIRSGSGVPDCREAMNDADPTDFEAAGGCSVSVRNRTHNGQVQHMVIPIPPDYNCDVSTLGGCWFSVTVDFSGSKVTDFTTWDASIGGQPVRLVE